MVGTIPSGGKLTDADRRLFNNSLQFHRLRTAGVAWEIAHRESATARDSGDPIRTRKAEQTEQHQRSELLRVCHIFRTRAAAMEFALRVPEGRHGALQKS